SFDTVLSLSGFVTAGSRILVESDTNINFGTTTVCDAPTRTITISNAGCDTLTIEKALFAGSGFYLSGLIFPLVLQPSEKVSATIVTMADTGGGKQISNGQLFLLSTSDSVLAPISLSHGYSYPKKYPLRLLIPRSSYHTLDTAILQIIADSLPTDLRNIDFVINNSDTDMMEFLTAKSWNTISLNGELLSISGNPITTVHGSLGELTYRTYLTKDSLMNFAISAIRFNQNDSDYERCIAYSVGSEKDTVFYDFACGEDAIRNAMNMNFSEMLFGVYPNPAASEVLLDVRTLADEDFDIAVCDMKGNVVLRRRVHHPLGRHAIELDISQLRSAAYFVKIKTEHSELSTSFVKEK
ncbi:MAG: T9SS type A sorting domain-containing protein, partial [Ignavibacteriota bacterium]